MFLLTGYDVICTFFPILTYIFGFYLNGNVGPPYVVADPFIDKPLHPNRLDVKTKWFKPQSYE